MRHIEKEKQCNGGERGDGVDLKYVTQLRKSMLFT
jgi:hypothetical protein